MNLIKFGLSLLSLLTLLFVLSRSWIVGQDKEASALPPLGPFLAPHTGFWQNAEGELPKLNSRLDDKKLAGPVSVYYDERLVPHIFALTLGDAYFAQGYVTASLRLWQMEFQTHAAAGRLSEFLASTPKRAEALLKYDRKQRQSGLPRAAKANVEHWKKDSLHFALLQRYADGVNAYINSLSYSDYPLEYKLLHYRPEVWTVEKTALLLKSMAQTLTGKDEDFALSQAYAFLGKTNFETLYPNYFGEQSPIILDSTRLDFEPIIKLKSQEASWPENMPEPHFPSPFEPAKTGLGSNNWAISPDKTAQGKAILCNDPHLKLNLPSIWFEIQIQTPLFNAYGASLPGAPGIISGFNDHIAWGITNVSHDVRDWYAINWTDASKQSYRFDNSQRQAQHLLDTIKIRNQAPFIDTIIWTHLGPIAQQQQGKDYALRWTAHDPGSEHLTFILLNRGRNYEDYLQAISHFGCPAQNMIFAANNGDIALWTQGKLPLRRPEQGRFVQDGSLSTNEWQGFIPQGHIPHEYNPKKGFVASANQHSIQPDKYPYPYYGYFEEYRGRYLNQKLSSLNKITIEDMKALQNDNFSQRGKDFLPLMEKYLRRAELNKNELEIWAKLENWDFHYQAESQAPVIFESWFEQLEKELYDEWFPKNPEQAPLRYPYEWTTLNLLKRDTLNPVWDKQSTDTLVENHRKIVTLAFKAACDSLQTKFGMEIPTWVKFRATSVEHLAQIPAFGFFNIQNGGDGSALNAMTPRNGPSWRMIVQLDAKEPQALGVYPGGQSGNPGSKFYANMLATWEKGEYFQLQRWPNPEAAASKALFQQILQN